jgi:hypothetical protein
MTIISVGVGVVVLLGLIFTIRETRDIRASHKAAGPPKDPTRVMTSVQADLRAQGQFRAYQDQTAIDLKRWRAQRRGAA